MTDHAKENSWKDSKSKVISVSFISAAVLISLAIGFAHFESYINYAHPPVASDTDLPERLVIPKIKVNAAIQKVGVDKTGKMGIPSNFVDVAWYQHGPQPGERGSAVIAGHLDTAKDANAVFINLNTLKKGDDIYVEDKNKTKIHFKVTAIEVYDEATAPVEKIFNQTGEGSRLNLITCDGVWNPKTKSYSERLVVYSERVQD